ISSASAPLSAVNSSNSFRKSPRNENKISGSSSTRRIGALIVGIVNSHLEARQGDKETGRQGEVSLRSPPSFWSPCLLVCLSPVSVSPCLDSKAGVREMSSRSPAHFRPQ